MLKKYSFELRALAVIALALSLLTLVLFAFLEAVEDEPDEALIQAQYEQRVAARQMGQEKVISYEITWPFYAYREPDFKAERVASLDPQIVAVLYENGDG